MCKYLEQEQNTEKRRMSDHSENWKNCPAQARIFRNEEETKKVEERQVKNTEAIGKLAGTVKGYIRANNQYQKTQNGHIEKTGEELEKIRNDTKVEFKTFRDETTGSFEAMREDTKTQLKDMHDETKGGLKTIRKILIYTAIAVALHQLGVDSDAIWGVLKLVILGG